MSIAEKRIENALARWLLGWTHRGTFTLAQQVSLARGSVADVVAIQRYQLPERKETIKVNIFEVKVGEIGLCDVEQVFRYASDVLTWRDVLLEQEAFQANYSDFELDVSCWLVGASVPDRALYRWAQDTGRLQFLTYSEPGPLFHFHETKDHYEPDEDGRLQALVGDLPWKGSEVADV